MQSLEQLKINIEATDEVQRMIFPAKQILSFVKAERFILKNRFQVSSHKLPHYQNELIEFSLQIDIQALTAWLQQRLINTPFSLLDIKQNHGTLLISGLFNAQQGQSQDKVKEIPFLLEGELLASPKELRFECYRGVYLGLQDQYLEQYELNQSPTLNLTTLIVQFFKALKLPTAAQNLAVVQIDLLTELSLLYCLEAGFKLPKRDLIPSFQWTDHHLQIYGQLNEQHRLMINPRHKQYLEGLRLFYENERLITEGLIEEAFYAYSMAEHPFAYQRVLELSLYLKNERPKLKQYLLRFGDKIDKNLCYQARYHDLELQYQSEVFFSSDLPTHEKQLVLLIDWMKDSMMMDGGQLFGGELFERQCFEMVFQQWLKLLKQDYQQSPEPVSLVLDYLYQQNDFMDAIVKLTVYDQLVEMELGLGRIDEATLLLEQQIEMAKLQANHGQIALSLVKLGEIYKGIDLEKAQAYYEQSISIKPQQVLAYQAKAVLYEEQEDWQQARKCYLEALKYSTVAQNHQSFRKEIESRLFEIDQKIFVAREFSDLEEDLPDGNTAAINRLAGAFQKVLPEDPIKKLKQIDFSLPQPPKLDPKVVEQRLNELKRREQSHQVTEPPIEIKVSIQPKDIQQESQLQQPEMESDEQIFEKINADLIDDIEHLDDQSSPAFEAFAFKFEEETEQDFESINLANELKIQAALQKVKASPNKDNAVDSGSFKKLESILTPNSQKKQDIEKGLSAEETAMNTKKAQLCHAIDHAPNRLLKNKARFELAEFLRDELLDFEWAERVFLEILEDAPLSQHEILEESIAYLTEKYTSLQSYQDLVSLYQKQIKKNFPNQPFLYLQKAVYHTELKEYHLALDAIQQAKLKLDQIKNQRVEYQKQKNKLQGMLALEIKLLELLNKHDEILERLTLVDGLSEDELQYQNLLCARYIAKKEPKQALVLYQSLYEQIDDHYFKESVYQEWNQLCDQLNDPTAKVPLIPIEVEGIDQQILKLKQQQEQATEQERQKINAEANKLVRKKSKLYANLAQELEDQAPMLAMELYQNAFLIWVEDFDSAEKICTLAKAHKKYDILIKTLLALINQCLEGEGKGKYLLELAGCYLILGDFQQAKHYADQAYPELTGDIFDPQALLDVVSWMRKTLADNQMDAAKVDLLLKRFDDDHIGVYDWERRVKEDIDH
jgi:tetratricopeptide (TPR) repeat protein